MKASSKKHRMLRKRVNDVTMPIHRKRTKWGRNWLCLCGSGKKYKHCCLDDIKALDCNDQNANVTPIPQEMITTIEKLKQEKK